MQPGNMYQDYKIKLPNDEQASQGYGVKLVLDRSLVILQVWSDTNRRARSKSSGCGERGLAQKTTIKPA